MATKKETKKNDADTTVVALETSVGETLVIRANPSDDDVRGFVQEHTRRYVAGEPGGPSGIPPFRIFTATRYASEESWVNGEEPTGAVEIEDLLPA